MKKAAPPIIAALLLLLPLLYVVSYLVLVRPGSAGTVALNSAGVLFYKLGPNYRWGGDFANKFYWPLEQIDRKLRPSKWDPEQELQLRSS